MKNMKLPGTLTQVREELGLTKAEYAERAGVSRAYISAIENQGSGKYGLNLGDIEKLTKPVRYAPAYARRICEAWAADHIARLAGQISDPNVRTWVVDGMGKELSNVSTAQQWGDYLKH